MDIHTTKADGQNKKINIAQSVEKAGIPTQSAIIARKNASGVTAIIAP